CAPSAASSSTPRSRPSASTATARAPRRSWPQCARASSRPAPSSSSCATGSASNLSPIWDRYSAALPSISAAVGNTPLVRLNRVTSGVTPPIFVKVEWYGATGSLKDRIYLHMFERAEASGKLKAGIRVLECSTGNAGIACAWVSAVKGYRCTIVMPEGMSEERKKIMRAYGAELVFTPGGESDVDLALERLRAIRAGDPTGYWVPGQFDNADNVEAHYRTTGPEIWEQCGGVVGAFVASQGSGGTLTGVGRYLRERDPRVRLYAVEPEEC